MDVRFAPTEAERRHKSGASASRYANIEQDCGVLCASGTRLAPTVVNTKIRSTEQFVRHLSTPTSSYVNFMSLPSITRLRSGNWMEGSFAYSGKSGIFALSANGEKLSGFWTAALFGTGTASLVAAK